MEAQAEPDEVQQLDVVFFDHLRGAFLELGEQGLAQLVEPVV